MDAMGNWGVFLLGIAALAAVLGQVPTAVVRSFAATFKVVVPGSREEILQRCQRALAAKAVSGSKGGFNDISTNGALGSIDAAYRKVWGGPNGPVRILVTERDGLAEIEVTVTSPNPGGPEFILSEFRKGFV
jgi:hypothetical protein